VILQLLCEGRGIVMPLRHYVESTEYRNNDPGLCFWNVHLLLVVTVRYLARLERMEERV